MTVLKRVLSALAVLAVTCGIMVAATQSAGAAETTGYMTSSHSLLTDLGPGTACSTDQIGAAVGHARVRVTNANPATFLGTISLSASVKLPKGSYDVFVAEPNVIDGVVVGCTRSLAGKVTSYSSRWSTFVCYSTAFGQGVHDYVQLVIVPRGGSQTGYTSAVFAVTIG